jgi:putative transcriptional regulator|tara:strand:+ start:399 stop:590 length:192 start_codon:yes stop_codon:yes gene_type:complete
MKNNIKTLRKKLNISQQKLAEDLNVSRQTINAIENGKFDPSLTLTIKLVRFFKIDLESIFEID